jgi:hypothetical protein
MIKRGIFPPPVWLSPNRCAWLVEDIERYEGERPRARPEIPAQEAHSEEDTKASEEAGAIRQTNGSSVPSTKNRIGHGVSS